MAITSQQLNPVLFYQELDGKLYGYIGGKKCIEVVEPEKPKEPPKQEEAEKPRFLKFKLIAPMPEAPKLGSDVHIAD